MPRPRPQLAKLTRPRLPGAVGRERLFALLDAGARRRLIWIGGPPGAGKTTLVSSWLETRGMPALWYQVDVGDADLATFFYYLGQAVEPFSRPRQRPLPTFGADHRHNVDGFSRRFFRELFARLPAGACVVFDDFQEAASDQLVLRVLATAMSEVPETVVVAIVSRRRPPDWFARFVVSERATCIDWDDLKLTLDETGAIVARRGSLATDELVRLHDRIGAWVAGLTLLLEQGRPLGGPEQRLGVDAMDQVFGYFADQSFDDLPSHIKSFLPKVALLPKMSADVAAQVTGEPRAGDILQELHRRHLFTERRPGTPPIYQFHALFRSFLLQRARRSLPRAIWLELAARAAHALSADNYIDDALDLYRDIGDWQAATRVVLSHAPLLLAQGRYQTVHQWLAALPAAVLTDDPWLGYWLGVACLPVDVPGARATLERAYERFNQAGDARGQLMAAAAVVDSYFYEDGNFLPLQRWVRALETHLGAPLGFASAAVELQVYAAALVAMFYTQPAHPLLPSCVEHVMRLLRSDADANQQIKAAACMLSYCSFACDLDLGCGLIASTRSLAALPEVADINRYAWLAEVGYLFYLSGRYEDAAAAFDAADEVGGRLAIPYMQASILSTRMQLASAEGDPESAARWLARLESVRRSARPRDLQLCLVARLWLAFYRGDFDAVEGVANETLAVVDRAGGYFFLALHRLPLACALVELGDLPRARTCIAEIRRLIDRSCLHGLETLLLLVEAHADLRAGDIVAGRRLLAEGLSRARRLEHGSLLCRLRPVIPQLAAEALAADIEREYVLGLIHQFKWPAPSMLASDWWWPVKILTLGRFQVLVDGRPVAFAGKAQKRPLELLKYLVAMAGPVDFETAADALWPGSDGDLAYGALEAALRRSRKLLHTDAAISRSAGKLALNPEVCWIDTLALQDWAAHVSTCASTQIDAGRVDELARFLWRHYGGHFLEREAERGWMLPARERLRGMFRRGVIAVGAAYARLGKWEEAAATYQRALAIDDAEELYRALHACSSRTEPVT